MDVLNNLHMIEFLRRLFVKQESDLYWLKKCVKCIGDNLLVIYNVSINFKIVRKLTTSCCFFNIFLNCTPIPFNIVFTFCKGSMIMHCLSHTNASSQYSIVRFQIKFQCNILLSVYRSLFHFKI